MTTDLDAIVSADEEARAGVEAAEAASRERIAEVAESSRRSKKKSTP